ncbi:hypothetical protein PoB_005765900 [Plakobranchus ocellatus]|uniref:Uncharacterized protein n=1 Tax=Plakobranchus ocellatus TaxID=259542 RepID=A0AAV4CJV1_9GAST|nr:hypothetical protein PoB_005765900 [Plakobranchus ocellatus]
MHIARSSLAWKSALKQRIPTGIVSFGLKPVGSVMERFGGRPGLKLPLITETFRHHLASLRSSRPGKDGTQYQYAIEKMYVARDKRPAHRP